MAKYHSVSWSNERSQVFTFLLRYLFVFCSKYDVQDMDPNSYVPQKQDVAEQLLVGLGWRCVGEMVTNNVHSVLVMPKDVHGSRFIITAKTGAEETETAELRPYADSKKIDQYLSNQKSRQGVAVLSFDLSDHSGSKDYNFGTNIKTVLEKYQGLHGNLLASELRSFTFDNGTSVKLFEAYAYYRDAALKQAEKGTMLRFVERESRSLVQGTEVLLPGFKTVPHEFDSTTMNLCFDHWVSNVINRESFLATLHDVLDFDIKVDFNAGVVAAGKAKIESTVTGNDPSADASEKELPASDEQNPQVYLPINNALSKYGHVYQFLQEIGQGVQHIASKVDNLVNLMERINIYRQITGRGFRSLRIPRVYYGCLDKEKHVQGTLQKFMDKESEENLQALSEKLFEYLISEEIISVTGIVNLDVTEPKLLEKLSSVHFHPETKTLSMENGTNASLDKDLCKALAEKILKARYINLYQLVGDDFDENTYLSIVRNQILLDIQGRDVLMQIFTANVMQREVGQEAPFLEFIQRKCNTFKVIEKDNKKVRVQVKPKPGCGGFGIRNFLTLFLSIEVSKAMDEYQQHVDQLETLGESKTGEGDEVKGRVDYCSKRIKLFTDQLDESNPILNEISEIMTEEAVTIEQLTDASSRGEESKEEVIRLQSHQAVLRQQKGKVNEKLQALSARYVSHFEELEKQLSQQ